MFLHEEIEEIAEIEELESPILPLTEKPFRVRDYRSLISISEI